LVRRFAIATFPRARYWIGSVFGLGIALSIAVFWTVRCAEQRAHNTEVTELVREHLDKLQETILRSTEVLHSIAALYQARGGIEPVEFRRFVDQALARQPALQAISWDPLVSGSGRAEFEQTARAQGLAAFAVRERGASGSLVPARCRPEYMPVCLIEPLDGNTGALGFDLYSDPSRRRSIDLARQTGQTVATAPVRLAQSNGSGGHDLGLLFLLPVYDARLSASSAVAERDPAGFAVAVFRAANLAEQALAGLKRRGIDASLYDDAPDGGLICSNGEPQAARNRLTMEVASRHWSVEYALMPGFVWAQGRIQSWFALVAGLGFTLLTTAYLNNVCLRTQEASEANRALQEEVQVRKSAEAAAAAANQAKSDFLASMSHEIRTPLNAILGYTHLMRRDEALPDDAQDAVGGIAANGQHLLGLVNEVLDLAKIEAGRMDLVPVEFDLRNLGRHLAATFKPLCAQQRIGFRMKIDRSSGATFVWGDEAKLRQVLINLIGNAVKFTSSGDVSVYAHTMAADHWQFEVIDTGMGIPIEEQPLIFKPFHQGHDAQHQGGTGLGLAIAQRQVRLLGGELNLESEQGKGSRFSFTIPLPPARGAELVASDSDLKAADEAAPAADITSSPVVLPESLSARLIVAAELHSTTALKAALQELQQLGPDARQLAEEVRNRMRSFEMESIQRLFSRRIVPVSVHGRRPRSE
jgi:signal transduction histidine kinase